MQKRMEKLAENQEIFSLLQNLESGSGVNPVSCLMGTASLSQEINGRCVKLITHLRLGPTLRICEAQAPLHHMTSWLAQGLYLYGVVQL